MNACLLHLCTRGVYITVKKKKTLHDRHIAEQFSFFSHRFGPANRLHACKQLQQLHTYIHQFTQQPNVLPHLALPLHRTRHTPLVALGQRSRSSSSISLLFPTSVAAFCIRRDNFRLHARRVGERSRITHAGRKKCRCCLSARSLLFSSRSRGSVCV